MALAALFVTVAVVAIGGKTSTTSNAATSPDLVLRSDGSDLPCPWCRAQTSEHDDHCPSCGQRFG